MVRSLAGVSAPRRRTCIVDALTFLTPLLTPFLLNCHQNESRADSNPPPIEIKATIQPAQRVTLTAQLDGQVRSISVREGEKVAANAEIAWIANPLVERDAALTRAQLEMLDARERRAKRPIGAAPAAPRDTLEISARILELRRQRLQTMRQLRKTNDITTRDLEIAEIEYLAALRDYNHERHGATIAPSVGDDAETIRIERERMTAEEKFAQERSALLHITSPIAGVVTRLQISQGQTIFPRDAIAEISDLSSVQVRGNVAPELLRYIRPGMRVDVRVMTVPPRTFADEIKYVIPVTGSTPESRSATVVVTIPNPDGSLQTNTDALITLRPNS
jgi:multidrug efflux pump subunit AcrA (membrane-fusion protein)